MICWCNSFFNSSYCTCSLLTVDQNQVTFFTLTRLSAFCHFLPSRKGKASRYDFPPMIRRLLTLCSTAQLCESDEQPITAYTIMCWDVLWRSFRYKCNLSMKLTVLQRYIYININFLFYLSYLWLQRLLVLV